MTREDIIQAIKEMTVLELNELVTACEEEFGVSAAAPVAVAGAVAGGAAAAEEKTEFDVVLANAGALTVTPLSSGLYASTLSISISYFFPFKVATYFIILIHPFLFCFSPFLYEHPYLPH